MVQQHSQPHTSAPAPATLGELRASGWVSRPIKEELRANAWLSAPVDLGLIFELPFESRWHAAGRLLGVELSRVSPTGGNA